MLDAAVQLNSIVDVVWLGEDNPIILAGFVNYLIVLVGPSPPAFELVRLIVYSVPLERSGSVAVVSVVKSSLEPLSQTNL